MPNEIYMPSDIKNEANRDAYYKVQDLMAAEYARVMGKTKDTDKRAKLKHNFYTALNDAIIYYAGLS